MKTENVEKGAKEGLTNSFISPDLTHINGHQYEKVNLNDERDESYVYQHIHATCSMCNKLKI